MTAEKKLGILEKENRELQEKLRYDQDYDRLTGLYNKESFHQKTARWLKARTEDDFYIVCVDIERFKIINDIYGPQGGDELLRYVARELKKNFPPEKAVLTRLANDVFAMCVLNTAASAIEETILQIFQSCPFDASVIPAIGLYRVTDRDTHVSLMCDGAIMALKSIKGNYLKHCAVYDSRQRNMLFEEQELLNDLESALENKEFKIFMQPKCDMTTGKIIGAEALVRWQHPQKGLILPGCFIPIFERNGFIARLDAYVWEETAAWLSGWIGKGYKPVPISVNMSRVDIYDSDVCQVLAQLMEKYKLDHSLLELEITESAYASVPEKIIETTRALMNQGFTVLMDDFGSGYSSLNILNDISVDILKMDMRFLEQDSQKSKDILKSVVRMSKWLNLPVIAEGVEYQGQIDFLLEIGCTCAQGYFFYRPMAIRDFEELLLDEGRLDYDGMVKLCTQQDMLLDFQDLFHKDFISDRLLGNILGAIAIYSFDGTTLVTLQGTQEYYQLTCRQPGVETEKDVLTSIIEEDRPKLINALGQAKTGNDENGAEVYVRLRKQGQPCWLYMHVFHLRSKGETSIFYASLNDKTQEMEMIEQLRISEEQFCLAMESTNIVLFEVDVKTREARYSDYTKKAFNLDATVANAPEGFIEQGTVCEESEDDFREVYDAIYRGEDKAACVIHAKMNGSDIVWNRITLTAIRNRHGETVRAVGTVETVCRDSEPPPEIKRELKRQAECRRRRKLDV